ncbi:methylated-DNA--[protein]-cysteine S-methyltransferase [Megalodesulfovibrio paquesii]
MLQDVLFESPVALVVRWAEAPGGGLLLTGLDLRWSEGLDAQASAAFPYRDEFRQRLQTHLRGEDPDWKHLPEGLELDMREVTTFSRTVLDTLWNEVGFGRTVTYGELARMAGRPGAARAVGRVMASNRWPLLIPCHRVLGSNGALTGFSGGGVEMKKLLLQKEGFAEEKMRGN